MDTHIKPDFLLIGAQKSSTTWLWNMLNQHPATDLPSIKEIHYFGGVENYRKGADWYFDHFKDLDPTKVIGEASTTYFFDHMPYWYNDSRQIEYDTSLPSIPELIASELPDVKILIILRDPVKRAVSAFRHWLRRPGNQLSPLMGVKAMAVAHPKKRILEFGFYARYLERYQQVFSPERIEVLIFEEDVIGAPEKGVERVYRFLGLDEKFQPDGLRKKIHKSSSFTRMLVRFYAGPLKKIIDRSMGNYLERNDFLRSMVLREADIDYLKRIYSEEKENLEALLGRRLECWDYHSS